MEEGSENVRACDEVWVKLTDVPDARSIRPPPFAVDVLIKPHYCLAGALKDVVSHEIEMESGDDDKRNFRR